MTDGSPLQNIGTRAPGLMYTVCHNGAQTSQSGFTTYSLLQCYYLPVNVRCLRDSLSVTDSGSHSGTPFEAPVVDFCMTKFT